MEESLSRIRKAAGANENLVPLFIDAVSNLATIGEIAGALREVFGEYRPAVAGGYY